MEWNVTVYLGANVEKITIPASVKTIGKRAFAHVKLTNVQLTEGVTTVQDEAFM